MNNKTQPESPRRGRAIALAAIVMILVVGWIGFLIPKGLLTQEDEFRTAERSREMLLLGRSAVREKLAVQEKPVCGHAYIAKAKGFCVTNQLYNIWMLERLAPLKTDTGDA